MEWYIIILAFILLIGLLQFNLKKYVSGCDAILLVILCFVLLTFAALRGPSVGADTKVYIEIFEYVKQLEWSEIYDRTAVMWWDSGNGFKYPYKLMLKGVSILFSSSQTVTVFNSTLLILFLYLSIKNASTNYLLSILVFVCLGFFQTSLNLIRVSIAFFICYIGLMNYSKNENSIQFFSYILFGFMIHSASIFFSVFFILKKIILIPMF